MTKDRKKEFKPMLGNTVSEAERIVISEINYASENQNVRDELLWIFTLGKIHNRWANSTRTNECLVEIRNSLDNIYSHQNVTDEFEYCQRFLATYENDIIDGSDIHKGKIKSALREVIGSEEFRGVIRDSTSHSVSEIFKDHKVQFIGSILIAILFFLVGKIF